jgi:hypothetical protein
MVVLEFQEENVPKCILFLSDELVGSDQTSPRRTSHGGDGTVHFLKMSKNSQFPDQSVRIKTVQIHYVTSHSY